MGNASIGEGIEIRKLDLALYDQRCFDPTLAAPEIAESSRKRAQQSSLFVVQFAWPVDEQPAIAYIGPGIEDQCCLLAAVFQFSDGHEMTAVGSAGLRELIPGQHLR